MTRLLILLVFALTGCAPVIDAQLRLIDVSRQGVAKVRSSIDDRQAARATAETAMRRQLDAAFDRDVDDQTDLTRAWVIEARTAYAAALDLLVRQQQAGRQSAEADKANLAAVDAALAQLEALSRAQQNFDVFLEKRK